MADYAPRPCSKQPCPNFASPGGRGRCSECAREYEHARGTTTERGYDGAWRKVRAFKLRMMPVCEIRSVCRGDMAVEVDHVVPLAELKRTGRWAERLAIANLQSACHACHAEKTLKENPGGGWRDSSST